MAVEVAPRAGVNMAASDISSSLTEAASVREVQGGRTTTSMVVVVVVVVLSHEGMQIKSLKSFSGVELRRRFSGTWRECSTTLNSRAVSIIVTVVPLGAGACL